MSHLPYWFNDALGKVTSPIGLPQDQARMIFSLFAAIPLGSLHSILPRSPLLKHVYSFLTGLFIAWFVVGHPAFYVLLGSVAIYFLAYVLPRRTMPFIVTFILVLLLSLAHLHRLYYHYLGWEMDVSLILMIFVVKASTFAFNWADGQALNHNEQLHAKPHIHQHRADRALLKFPSLIEYLSYIWYFGGVLVGPCFEMKEYLDFTDFTLFRQFGLTSIPSTIIPALRQVGVALLCYPFVYIHSLYPIIGYVNTPAYAALPFLQRFTYFWITMTCSRFKYYFAWYLSAGGCISSGLGLSAVHPDPIDKSLTRYKWDRCSNVDAVKVELATSMPQITNYWNMGINNWLKHYIYFRIDPPRSVTRLIPTKSLANVVTKLTSAFWHGFYPAYYLFFLGAYIVNEMDDALRGHLQPRMQSGGVRLLYNGLAWFLLFASMNMLGMAFMLLKLEWSLEFWATFYYAVFWVPLIVIGVCKIALPVKRKDGGKRHATDAANGKGEVSNGNGAASVAAGAGVKKEL